MPGLPWQWWHQGAGQWVGQCTMSGCPQEVDRWSRLGSRAVTLAGSSVAPPLWLFFLSVTNIFWNPFLRCIYLSLFHRCFVSLHFWGICKASDKSELSPSSQWDFLHASFLLNGVPFYILWIGTLIGHDNCEYVLHFIHHFLFCWWCPMVRVSSLMETLLITFPFTSFPFGITPKFHCQDWITGSKHPFHSRS